MAKYIIEQLEEINSNPEKIYEYKDSNALKLLLEHAFNPSAKFVLPDGNPPYKEDPAPLGMSPANFVMELKRLYVFCREDLNAVRRETLFVQLLENVHPTEAKLLLAVKDQSLSKLYKNITHKLVYDAGLVSVGPVVKTKKQKVLAGAEL
jgi:hypothetical protein